MAARPTNLCWRGAQTIADAKDAIAHRASIALSLPAGFHHAVQQRLLTAAGDRRRESVDVEGGAELLARLAEIKGLATIAELQAPVTEAQARVRVMSPSPTVLIVCQRGRSAERHGQ